MNAKSIMERQNEDKMLRYQFSARRHFNLAEKWNYACWALLAVSWASMFLPDTEPLNTIRNVGIVVIDLIATFCAVRTEKNAQLASALRAHFDAYVFGLEQLSDFGNKWELDEITLKDKERFPQKFDIQTKNTGSDVPPGVKDWYEIDESKKGIAAILECHGLNSRWETRLEPYRIIAFAAMVVILVSFMVVVLCVSALGPLAVLLSSVGLILHICKRIYITGCRYRVMIQINTLRDAAVVSNIFDNVVLLQKSINEYRKYPVLGIDLVHKLKAKNWTERDRSIQRDNSSSV